MFVIMIINPYVACGYAWRIAKALLQAYGCQSDTSNAEKLQHFWMMLQSEKKKTPEDSG